MSVDRSPDTPALEADLGRALHLVDHNDESIDCIPCAAGIADVGTALPGAAYQFGYSVDVDGTAALRWSNEAAQRGHANG